MPIDDTKCIEDVHGRIVNEYLSLGWVLLKIYTVDFGNPGAPSAIPHYILGWQDSSMDPKYPASVLEERAKPQAF